ncbi:MAG: hypothetical protein IPJ19_00350 [Planctomycetes bacterium]|nr:hypothetical protein [Planctomycetota bacterium]
MQRSLLCAGLLLATLAGACTAVGYRSSCFEVTFGELDFDWSTGQASLSSLCIRRLGVSCPQLQNCSVQAGIDQNGNGVLDPSEVTLNLHDEHPGGQFCVTAANANLTISPADHGKKLIMHYEAGRSDQPDQPFVSKDESKTLD